MTITNFIKSLPFQMNEYEIDMIWKWQHHCPVCDKYYELEDEGQNCGISEFYELDIEDCTILFENTKITITHTEQQPRNNCICKICKSCNNKEQPINLFEKPLTEQKQIELSNALDGFSQWYEKHFDEKDSDDDFHSDLKNLYLMERMLRIGIL